MIPNDASASARTIGLRLRSVDKSYGAVRVIDQISLEVPKGEFLAVLGPSGCGKTTLLRLLAGFEAPNSGSVELGGRLVAGPGKMVPPEERGVGIVFQNYALWPHMSVAENVGYALKVAKLPKAEREARVAEALETVNLTPLAARRPADLSGGQRQRVALARCLAAATDLVLLDEPLANLDVHLRAAMEDEFRRFHQQSGATLVYITHDQSEAMALADRVAVMDKGRILQCASPQTLYREPASATVAAFIGDGIVLPASDITPLGGCRARAKLLGVPVELRCHAAETSRDLGLICTHPRDIFLAEPGQAGIAASVLSRVYRGGLWSYVVAPDEDPSLRLSFELADLSSSLPHLGETVRIGFSDLWAIPAAGDETPRGFDTIVSHSERDLQCV